jgi:transglutaminase-like putative cysteine protease
MKKAIRFTLIFGLALNCGMGAARADSHADRTLDLTYSVEIRDLDKDAKSIKLWMPLPQSGKGQAVTKINVEGPGAMKIVTESKYGNQFLFFEIPNDGTVPKASATYRVTRSVRNVLNGKEPTENKLEDIPRHYLLPSRLVALGGPVKSEAQSIAGGLRNPTEIARALYDNIVNTVRYDKSGEGWGRGDSLYACDAREGNCTDFHSLFIGEARSLLVPTRFVMGFPIPNEIGKGTIGGYHCWAEFYSDEHGWVPLDASEAQKHPEKREFLFGNLDQNRVQFTLGRDLELPGMQGEPLNYSIYPYVEVDGKAHAAMETVYRYEDVD